MRAVFLSYRRDDTQTVTGFIYQHLTALNGFGPDGVFMDIDDIPPGIDFRDVIDESVGQCRFFLAVIGPRWVNARLQHPGDFVRLEIEAALKRGIPVVPLLVDGAVMPKPEELPESLRPLVYMNATSVRPGRQFATDIAQLVKGLHKAEEWTDRGRRSSAQAKSRAGEHRPPEQLARPPERPASIPPHRGIGVILMGVFGAVLIIPGILAVIMGYQNLSRGRCDNHPLTKRLSILGVVVAIAGPFIFWPLWILQNQKHF